MPTPRPSRRTQLRRLLACGLAITLAACSSQREPATAQLAAIKAAIEAAQPDAGRYVPAQLAEVQARLVKLEQRYAAGDFRAVVEQSADVLSGAHQLLVSAAARRAEVSAQLRAQWPAVADTLPQWLEGLERRVDRLSKLRAPPRGIDLSAGRAALEEARRLWGQALAAFASDNLEEALATAGRAKERAASAAAALGMPPPA